MMQLERFVEETNMKNRTKRFLSLLAFGSITLSGCYLDLGFIQFGEKPSEEGENNEGEQKSGQKIYDEEKQAARIAEYYANIDSSLSGEDLLTSLRNLNLSMRKTDVGYNAMSSTSL